MFLGNDFFFLVKMFLEHLFWKKLLWQIVVLNLLWKTPAHKKTWNSHIKKTVVEGWHCFFFILPLFCI